MSDERCSKVLPTRSPIPERDTCRLYTWCWVPREATFVRFFYGDLSDAFTNVCDGVVIDGVWNSSAGYVSCPD